MKKILTITTMIVLLSFTFIVTADAFFCDEYQHGHQGTETSQHCCANSCPAHNLLSFSSKITFLQPSFSKSFISENLNLFSANHPSFIDRPPIL